MPAPINAPGAAPTPPNNAPIAAPAAAPAPAPSLSLSPSLSLGEARLVLGVLYELRLRKLTANAVTVPYVFAEDLSVELISILNDGAFEGVVIGSKAVRQYNTDYAAHILGYVGKIGIEDDYPSLKEKGYDYDDLIGKVGAELAFEEYLRGKDGRRMVATNDEGKVTGEYYSTEPVPGNTVELTIDLDFQSQVEDCSHYVVLCSRRSATRRDVDRYLAQIEFTRRPSAEKLASSAGFYTSYVEALTPEKMHAWLDCQVYIAVGFLLSAAAALRVDSCTIGGMDSVKYDEILGLDGTPYRSVVGVALGYRAKDDSYAREAKVRFPAGEVMDIRA